MQTHHPKRSADVRVGHLHLDQEHVKEIESRLSEFFAKERPFLQQGYTLRQLTADIRIPLHHISAFINQHYGMNFNDFINRFRVDHYIMKIAEGEWRYKKLEAIAGEAGFNNRNTFRIAFKKATGLSPSAYLKKQLRKIL